MTMIAEHALGHIRHALGGDPAAPLTGLGILNEAGEFLVSMHRWGWLERPPATLDLVSGQAYVSLPSDFSELVAYDATNSLVNSLSMTTHQHLLELRTNQIQSTSWNFWASIVYAVGTNGVPAPRLEFWPTPSASDTGALTIIYRAGWTALSDDSDTIAMPSWMHSLYLACVRAFAKGYEESDAAPLEQWLALIEQGPQFRAAKLQDSATQTDFGTLEGGAAQLGGYTRSWDFAAGNPS